MVFKDTYKISGEQWRELADDAYDLGFCYEKTYHGCGQCTIAAVLDTLKIKTDAVFCAATGLSGGLGLMGEATCSALTGAVLTFGLAFPRHRDKFDDDRENKYRTFKMAQEIYKRYINQFSSITCHDIHTKILGRPYDLRDPNERNAFEKAGAHETKCTEVVALASKWAVEIIGEEIMLDHKALEQ